MVTFRREEEREVMVTLRREEKREVMVTLRREGREEREKRELCHLGKKR
jgi:hypothetical protein